MFYANKNHNMAVLCELIGCGAKFNFDEIDGKAALFHGAKNNLGAFLGDSSGAI